MWWWNISSSSSSPLSVQRQRSAICSPVQHTEQQPQQLHTPHLRSPDWKEAIPRYTLQRQGALESRDALYVEQNGERFRACSNYNTLLGNVSTTSSRNTGDTSSAHNTHPLWEFRLPWTSSANNWSQHQVSSKETKASLHFLLATVVQMVPLPCSLGLGEHIACVSLVSISDTAKKGNQCF